MAQKNAIITDIREDFAVAEGDVDKLPRGRGWACGIYNRLTDRLEEMTPQELLARRTSVPTREKAAMIARALRS